MNTPEFLRHLDEVVEVEEPILRSLGGLATSSESTQPEATKSLTTEVA